MVAAFHREVRAGSPLHQPDFPVEGDLGGSRTFTCKKSWTRLRSRPLINGNLEEYFDGLIDLVYVALGAAYLSGLPFDEGFKRVHEANMKKVRALRQEDSKRGSTYDIVKPAGFVAPTLTDLIRKEKE
jgi:predicted HAD superfamily Cof-like phosphohydrolase